jgi:hypothetical protein
MALPIESGHTQGIYKEVFKFLWTTQLEGQTQQKRRLVA